MTGFAARDAHCCPTLAPVSWRNGGKLIGQMFGLVFCAACFALSGCHSYHIDTTIENRTGAPIQLLEVDYPSASFGVDRLEAGAVYRYRFQIRGSGSLKIEYSTPDGHQVEIAGPALVERQQGQLQIVLLPGAKADFMPRLDRNP